MLATGNALPAAPLRRLCQHFSEGRKRTITVVLLRLTKSTIMVTRSSKHGRNDGSQHFVVVDQVRMLTLIPASKRNDKSTCSALNLKIFVHQSH